ncbi:hypothetical protein AOC05_17885 [Arthrobacter alpinus]|uniref:Uncharacterized protein n=1 Tax=Arthrobacter alpinus TaxID=656366 RepID=A0A0M4R123_9MICC|nr:hypothetical protein [Arthrobacter alpinus]ALE93764.1 hypothetical protein AOC05_17885 [Arthrobacter alpinus]
MERMETIWQLDPSCAPSTGQEIVVLTSWRIGVRFKATVVRTWVSDLDGTGLEADITDPVEVLSETINGELAGFHARAITEVLRRLGSDYQVADLFCDDQALGYS